MRHASNLFYFLYTLQFLFLNIHYIGIYFFSLTNEDFQLLAEAIVKNFPTEVILAYYISAIPKKLSRIGKRKL